MVLKKDESEGFEEPSLLSSLLMPFRSVKDWIGDAISGDDSFRDRESGGISSLLTFPFRLLWGFVVFMVQAWTTSRNGIAFLRGTPALGVMAFTPFLVWAFNHYDRQITMGPTMGYNQMHARNGDFDKALLFSKKLVELSPESDEFKFMMANDMARSGDLHQAKRIMEYLAGDPLTEEQIAEVEARRRKTDSEDAASADPVNLDTDASEKETTRSTVSYIEDEKFARAHLWLAQRLNGQMANGDVDEEKSSLAMAHLRTCEAISPNLLEAKAALISLLETRVAGQDEGSEPYQETLRLTEKELLSFVRAERLRHPYRVEALRKLVDVYTKLGDSKRADAVLKAGIGMASVISRDFPDQVSIWNSLVEAALTVEDYQLAYQFVVQGIQTARSAQARQQVASLTSKISKTESDKYKDISNKENFQKRLYVVCRSISRNPNDLDAYKRLVEYIDIEDGGTNRDVWLRDSIIDCPIPAIVHIVLGTRQLLRGDIASGKTSWEIASFQYPAGAGLVVHRLVSLAANEDSKYASADLIDSGIELFDKFFMLYETRGKLLKEEGKFEDAINDFKIVEQKSPSRFEVHLHLKYCYEKIGNAEEAAKSAARIEELLDTLDEERRKTVVQKLRELYPEAMTGIAAEELQDLQTQ